MGNTPYFSAGAALESLSQIAEKSFTVLQLAELGVKRVDPFSVANQALQWMRDHRFDAAPIDEPEAHRFVAEAWLQPDDGPVIKQAQPIDATLLVSADLSLLDGVSRLRAHPFYFILQRDGLSGIVTRADLQRPAVGIVLFSLILISEAAMNMIIEQSWALRGYEIFLLIGERA